MDYMMNGKVIETSEQNTNSDARIKAGLFAVAFADYHYRRYPRRHFYRDRSRRGSDPVCCAAGVSLSRYESVGSGSQFKGNGCFHFLDHADRIGCFRLFLDTDPGTGAADADGVDAADHRQQVRFPDCG